MLAKWSFSVVFSFWLMTHLVAGSLSAQQTLTADEGWLTVSNSEIKVNVQVRGPGKTAEVEFYTEALHYKRGDLVQEQRLGIMRDLGTSYIWWTIDNQLPKVLEEYAAETWLIPEFGLVRVTTFNDVIFADISSVKAKNHDESREKALAYLRSRSRGDKPSIERRELRVRIGEMLGDDFFFKHGDAAPPPRAKILRVSFVSGNWEIELQSALTKEQAIVELSSDFQVLKAIRNGKQTFP